MVIFDKKKKTFYFQQIPRLSNKHHYSVICFNNFTRLFSVAIVVIIIWFDFYYYLGFLFPFKFIALFFMIFNYIFVFNSICFYKTILVINFAGLNFFFSNSFCIGFKFYFFFLEICNFFLLFFFYQHFGGFSQFAGFSYSLLSLSLSLCRYNLL